VGDAILVAAATSLALALMVALLNAWFRRGRRKPV
jgi:hypothetical protein